MGETTHSALYLNQKDLTRQAEQVEMWALTRLLIIDKISFCKQGGLS
jgi:hypothetical protein